MADSRPNIILYGDSITKRNVEYDFKGRGRVTSRGCNGYTTKEAILPQEEEVFKYCENAHVVLFFGSNDSILPFDSLPPAQAELLKSWKGESTSCVTVEEYKENLKVLIRQVRSIYGKTVVVYLVTPPAPCEDKRLKAMQTLEKKYTAQWEDITQSDRSVENTTRYVEATKQIAAEGRCELIDIFTPMLANTDLYTTDGVHPSKEGNQLIADCVLATIRKVMGFEDIEEEDGWTAV